MGCYRGLYEDYYKEIERGDDFSNIESRDYDERSSNYTNHKINYRNNHNKKTRRGSILNIIVIQTIGALILISIISVLKYIPNKELNNIYLNAKEGIAYNQNFEELEVVEVFNEVKDKITNVMINNNNDNKNSNYEAEKLSLLPPVVGTLNSVEDGVVINNKEQKDIFAASSGQVKEVKIEKDKANIVIDHKNGYETYYENVSNPLVKVEDNVEAGECIGSNTKISDNSYEIKFKVSYMGKLKDAKEYMDINDDNI